MAQILALLENLENSRRVVDCLLQSGHNVVPSASFSDAIVLLKRWNFALILSDVHLQNGGNVFDFIRWVKSNKSTTKVPFVLFSSRPSPTAKYLEDASRTTARLLGANMYISMDKFDSDKFRTKIDSLIPPEARTHTTTAENLGEFNDL